MADSRYGRETWLKSQEYTPEMLVLALKVLEEVRRGATVERHPPAPPRAAATWPSTCW